MPFIGADRRNYHSLGYCIYCGDKGELSREHIIPYAFGGNWVVPSASCKRCATITGQFEQAVMRSMFGPMRHQFGFPTRRRRPTTIDFDVHVGQRIERRPILIEDSPTVPILAPVFDAPGILRNAPPTAGFPERIAMWVWQPASDDQQKSRIERIHQNVADGVSLVLDFPIGDFSKLLAKIAHAGAVAEYHIGRIPSMLPDYVLGRKETYTHLIGCSDIAAGCPNRSNWCVEFGIVNCGDQKYLTARINLLRFFDGPTYWVVVSKADDELENVVLGRTPRPSGMRGITRVSAAGAGARVGGRPGR